MKPTPATGFHETEAGAPHIARSAVLENSVVVGNSKILTTVGRRTTFGHRCVVVGATVGDLCEIGNAGCVVRAGAVVKQRSQFAAGTDIDGFPAVGVGGVPAPPPTPAWALRLDDLAIPAPHGSDQ